MRIVLLPAITLLLTGCFTNGTEHFAYAADGIPMPDLRGRWISLNMDGEVDSSFHVVIGDLPTASPTWEHLSLGDSVLRTRDGLYYRDGLSFTYWSIEDRATQVSYHPAPAMVISFFRLGNDTFFEAHLPERYLERPGIARLLWDSLGEGVTSSVLVRHHVGRVLHYQRDTIEYTYGWSDKDVLMRIAREQGMDATFIAEGSYDAMLHGSTGDLRSLLEATAKVDSIRFRYRLVRTGR